MKTHVDIPPEASRILSKAEELQENAKDSVQRAMRVTSDYVEENPWTVIAIVAVCALALGFLLRPRD